MNIERTLNTDRNELLVGLNNPLLGKDLRRRLQDRLYDVDTMLSRLMNGVKETNTLPFGKEALSSEIKQLKVVTNDQITALWNQWNTYVNTPNREIDWYTNELENLMSQMFRHYSLEKDGVGIDALHLENTTRHLEDVLDVQLMTDPHKLACGHRFSRDNLVHIEVEGQYKCPNLCKESAENPIPVADTPLGAFIAEYRHII